MSNHQSLTWVLAALCHELGIPAPAQETIDFARELTVRLRAATTDAQRCALIAIAVDSLVKALADARTTSPAAGE